MKERPLLPSPSPSLFFFLLLLQISRYNSTGNACYAGYFGSQSVWFKKKAGRDPRAPPLDPTLLLFCPRS